MIHTTPEQHTIESVTVAPEPRKAEVQKTETVTYSNPAGGDDDETISKEANAMIPEKFAGLYEELKNVDEAIGDMNRSPEEVLDVLRDFAEYEALVQGELFKTVSQLHPQVDWWDIFRIVIHTEEWDKYMQYSARIQGRVNEREPWKSRARRKTTEKEE